MPRRRFTGRRLESNRVPGIPLYSPHMKTHALACVVLVVVLTSAGCLKNSPGSSPPNSSQRPSATSSEVPFPGYAVLFQRDARPEWQAIQLRQFSVAVPYSKDWKFSDVGLSVFDTESVSEGTQTIRFGRPADAGTSATREYFLFRRSHNQQPDGDSLEYLQRNLSCVDGFPSRIITIGNREGVEHHVGGAKGCSTGFVFNQGEYSYYLYRVPDIGKAAPDIDEEMEKIIQSIRQ
jgi:hypothetical protein